MKLRSARIGYDGYSPDLDRPGDRRRFCAYADRRGLSFERARTEGDYDLVVVSHNGDVAAWTERKRRNPTAFKLVFELADSYFAQRGLARRLLKGAGRYSLGFDSRPSLDFLKTLERACTHSDAVICTTEEQKHDIAQFNPNAFVTFDWFDDELGEPKSDYGHAGKFRLVWEGQSSTLRNLLTIAPALEALRDEVELHVVTDPTIPRFFGRFGASASMDFLKTLPVETLFHPWSIDSFSRLITDCDAAIIPIDRADAFARGKPENKLVMFWQLGMPVLTSATPAYERTMRFAGMDLTCDGPDAWRKGVRALMDMTADERRAVGTKGRSFAAEAYSEANFLARFDAAFEAAGFEP